MNYLRIEAKTSLYPSRWDVEAVDKIPTKSLFLKAQRSRSRLDSDDDEEEAHSNNDNSNKEDEDEEETPEETSSSSEASIDPSLQEEASPSLYPRHWEVDAVDVDVGDVFVKTRESRLHRLLWNGVVSHHRLVGRGQEQHQQQKQQHLRRRHPLDSHDGGGKPMCLPSRANSPGAVHVRGGGPARRVPSIRRCKASGSAASSNKSDGSEG